ncbi:hypothetical protein H9Q74_011735, partial [Fusarium xylarioides]
AGPLLSRPVTKAYALKYHKDSHKN